MTQPEPPSPEGYLTHWRRVGLVLEGIRRRELQEYDFKANRPIIDGLLEIAVQHAQPRTTCGYAEFHRKLREHYESRAQGK